MIKLTVGSRGEEVKLLQRALNENLQLNMKADGVFGPGTLNALKRFQIENEIPVTGVYDEATYDSLNTYISDRFIRLSDIDLFADALSVEPAALKAVFIVESNSAGFLPNSKPTILFEGHIFYKLIAKTLGQNTAIALSRKYPNVCYMSWDRSKYYGGDKEYIRLNQAQSINESIANQSASWGLFQIMGFNYKAAGYNDIDTFVDEMYYSEHLQFQAGCNFIASNAGIINALRKKDWNTFARLYNGPAYAQNNYHNKLAAAYRQNL